MEEGQGGGEEAAEGQLVTNSGILISESRLDPPSTCQSSAADSAEDGISESKSPVNHTEIFRAVEVVERDSLAIAESFSSLFDSLRLVLSEVCHLFFFLISFVLLILFGCRESEGNSRKLQIFYYLNL